MGLRRACFAVFLALLLIITPTAARLFHQAVHDAEQPDQATPQLRAHDPTSSSASGSHIALEAIRDAVPAAADKGTCPVHHFKEQCTLPHCIWCNNKYSPWPGSDGVCIDEDEASQLPAWTYECHHVHPDADLVTAAAEV